MHTSAPLQTQNLCDFFSPGLFEKFDRHLDVRRRLGSKPLLERRTDPGPTGLAIRNPANVSLYNQAYIVPVLPILDVAMFLPMLLYYQ